MSEYSEQRKHRQSHYLVETAPVSSAAVDSTLQNIDLMHDSLSGGGKERGGDKGGKVTLPPLNSRGNYDRNGGASKKVTVPGNNNKRVSFKG
jgi:hypothetical protein